MESVAAALPDALAPILARHKRHDDHKGVHGAHVATLILAWDAIAGPQLAPHTRPKRLTTTKRTKKNAKEEAKSGGILTIEVDPGFALEVQHCAPEMIARINAHMGYVCVSRLRLLQSTAQAGVRAGGSSPHTP
ncbi:MAG: DciA family protein [Alphaproteobacteria bacterium]